MVRHAWRYREVLRSNVRTADNEPIDKNVLKTLAPSPVSNTNTEYKKRKL